MGTALKLANGPAANASNISVVPKEFKLQSIPSISIEQKYMIWRSRVGAASATTSNELQTVVSSFLQIKNKKNLNDLDEDEYYELLKYLLPELGPQELLKLSKSEKRSLNELGLLIKQSASNNVAIQTIQNDINALSKDYSDSISRIEKDLKFARISYDNIDLQNVSWESQKGFFGSRLFVPWRKSSNQLISELQQENKKFKIHLGQEIARLTQAKEEQSKILLELQKAQLAIVDKTKLPQATEINLYELISVAKSHKEVKRLKFIPDGYNQRQKEINKDFDKLISSAEHIQVGCRITRDVAIGTAATVATGGAAAALGTGFLAATGAVAIGTATGTTVSALSQVAEQSTEVALNDKNVDQAWKDGLSNTKKGAVTSVVASLAVVGGGAAARGVLGIGGKITGNLAPQILAKSPLAIKIVSQVVAGITTGGTYGVVSSSIGQAQTVVAAYLVYNASGRGNKLGVKEYAQDFIKFLGEQGLTLSEAIKQTLHSAIVGSLAGVIGSSAGIVRASTQSLAGKGLTLVAEVGASSALGIGSAAVDAKRHGRELSFQLVAEQITFAIIGTAVSEATQRIANSKNLKEQGRKFFENEAEQIGKELIEGLGEKGLKKTIYEDTYKLAREKGLGSKEARQIADLEASKVSKETVIEYIKAAAQKSAEKSLDELEIMAGTEGLTKDIYDKTLQKALDKGLSASEAKSLAQEAGLEYAVKTVKEVSRKNTEIVHDELFKKMRVSEQVEELVTVRLQNIDKKSWRETARQLEQQGFSRSVAKAMSKQAHYAIETGRNDKQVARVLIEGITNELANFTIKHGEATFQSTFRAGISPQTALGQVFMKDASRVGKSYAEYTEIMVKAATDGYKQGVKDSARKAVTKGVVNALKNFRAKRNKSLNFINNKKDREKKKEIIKSLDSEQEEFNEVPYEYAQIEKVKEKQPILEGEKLLKIKRESIAANGDKSEITEVYKVTFDESELTADLKRSKLVQRDVEIILAKDQERNEDLIAFKI